MTAQSRAWVSLQRKTAAMKSCAEKGASEEVLLVVLRGYIPKIVKIKRFLSNQQKKSGENLVLASAIMK